nr:hypothetical protein [Micromonospora sp. AMSO31t]
MRPSPVAATVRRATAGPVRVGLVAARVVTRVAGPIRIRGGAAGPAAPAVR